MSKYLLIGGVWSPFNNPDVLGLAIYDSCEMQDQVEAMINKNFYNTRGLFIVVNTETKAIVYRHGLGKTVDPSKYQPKVKS